MLYEIHAEHSQNIFVFWVEALPSHVEGVGVLRLVMLLLSQVLDSKDLLYRVDLVLDGFRVLYLCTDYVLSGLVALFSIHREQVSQEGSPDSYEIRLLQTVTRCDQKLKVQLRIGQIQTPEDGLLLLSQFKNQLPGKE